MKALIEFLAGKKTYLAAALTGAFAVGALHMGWISVSEAGDLLALAAGMVGFGAKLERHHGELVAALTKVAESGEQARKPESVK